AIVAFNGEDPVASEDDLSDEVGVGLMADREIVLSDLKGGIGVRYVINDEIVGGGCVRVEEDTCCQASRQVHCHWPDLKVKIGAGDEGGGGRGAVVANQLQGLGGGTFFLKEESVGRSELEGAANRVAGVAIGVKRRDEIGQEAVRGSQDDGGGGVGGVHDDLGVGARAAHGQ